MVFLRSWRSQSLVFLITALLLTLTACASNNGGGNSNSSSANNTSNSASSTVKNSTTGANSTSSKSTVVSNPSKNNSANNNNSKNNPSATATTTTNKSSSTSNANKPAPITVGAGQDTEAQLLAQMYVLLLRHAGFTVVEHVSVGTSDTVFAAMMGGHIDLYPAFTANALGKLGLNSTGIAQLDYLQMKQGYEAKYHVTWLDPAPLNAKVYDAAPIVRDSILKKAPLIATTLNKLAPILTTQATQQLQSEVVKNGKSVTVVATQFLQSKGLL